ncbi:non-ribosomal peptide synthetase [Paenibacillus tepidiphilus]|uniref:non-ribosomal peptide synthetase n=1 Tax=Paenibacillus tepidiphilus TaxID=2608683 RepID=UPI00123BF50C|nr:non-ribosomal peptide synthetase [Paenibacillus tepidiphilus]
MMLDKQNIEDILNLTTVQEGMLFHYLNKPESRLYHEQLSFEIRGDVDLSTFKAAWDYTVQCYEMLRTVFRWSNLKKPVQIIQKNHSIPIEIAECAANAPDEIKASLEELKQQLLQAGLNLQEHPMTIALFKTANDTSYMIVSFHHIIFDGWSLGILLQRFLKAYHSLVEGEQLPANNGNTAFKEYIRWQKKQDTVPLRAFWHQYLKGYPCKTTLPFDNNQSNEIEIRQVSYDLGQGYLDKVNHFVRQRQITLSVFVNVLWGCIIYKNGNEEDVLFGSLVSGRPSHIRGIEESVGIYVNTLPLRMKVTNRTRMSELLEETSNSMIRRIPFESTDPILINECAEVNTQDGLYDSLVIVENYPLSQLNQEQYSLRIQIDSIHEITNYPLVLQINPFDGLQVVLNYHSNRFEKETVEFILSEYIRLLEKAIENPACSIEEYQVMSSERLDSPSIKLQQEASFRCINEKDIKGKTIAQYLNDSMERYGERIAIEIGEYKTTYKELHKRSSRIAHAIWNQSKQGESPTPVALLFRHGAEMIYGTVAALMAGEPVVFLDHTFPSERLLFMIADSGSTVIVTNNACKEAAEELSRKGPLDLVIINIDDLEEQNNERDLTLPSKSADDIACLLYTSGSTGNPKGVIQINKNVLFYIAGYINSLHINENDRIALFTTYSHAVAFIDVLSTLMTGGTLLPYDLKDHPDKTEVVRWLIKNKVTIYHSVPTVYRYLLQNQSAELRFPDMRLVVLGGEGVNKHDFQIYQKHFADECLFVNFFGASEVLTAAFYFLSKSSQMSRSLVPIGRFIPGLEVKLLNEKGQKSEVLGVGELVYQSEYIVPAYWNDAANSAKFTDAGNGTVIYRSGDLGRLLPDGAIEYLGRKDQQIKIHGHRVEVAEIETVLNELADISGCVVVLEQSENQNPRLEAYYTTYTDKRIQESELREYVKKHLPSYMVPYKYIHLSEFPLTPNGKVDRLALRIVHTSIIMYRQPAMKSETGLKLETIWKRVLSVEQVGEEDNFFALGGHSLKLFEMVSYITKDFGIELSVGEIYQQDSFSSLVEYVQQKLGSVDMPQIAGEIECVEDKPYYKLSSPQRRIYYHWKSQMESTAYNQTVALQMDGELNLSRVEDAFRALMARHEALRTSIHLLDGEPVQRIEETTGLEIEYMQHNEELLEATISAFIRPFNIETAPLMRVGIVHVNNSCHVLLLDMHHIITDGASMSILTREFADLYGGKELPELKYRYRDFTSWHNQIIASDAMRQKEAYWTNKFQDGAPVLEISGPPAGEQVSHETTVHFELDEELSSRLNQLSAQTNSSLFMILLAVYKTLLFRYSGQSDIVVGIPIAGRNAPEFRDTVGMFVNMLPVRSFIAGNMTFRQLLADLKAVLLEDYENQQFPFEMLADKLDLTSRKGHNPLFNTIFVLQSTEVALPELEDVHCSRYPVKSGSTPFDIELNAVQENGKIHIRIEFDSSLFGIEFIRNMSEHYVNIAQHAVKLPDGHIGSFSILSQADARKLQEFNRTAAPYTKEATIQAMFERQVARTPDQLAVLYKEQALTYKELNNRANLIADLLMGKGIGRNEVVGIYMKRTPEMVIAILGVLKAGGAYLPLSPDFPETKIKYMLEDSKAVAVLTESLLSDQINTGGTTICLDLLEWPSREYANPSLRSGPRDLAYVIYTSGTTGNPKGVMIEHHSVINRIEWMQKEFPVGEDHILLQKTPNIFDVSVWELLWWGWYGAKACILEQGEEKNAGQIVEAIFKHKVTTIHFVPSMLNAFLGYMEEHMEQVTKLSSLRNVFCSGEALDVTHVDRFNKVFHTLQAVVLCNLYGPTEATVDVSYYVCSRNGGESCIPIGQPISNNGLHILNEALAEQPVGIAGELCISGAGLARGYLNKPELTEKVFIDDPDPSRSRLYRTGDLARWLPDGKVQYLGRMDHQVKIRGYRIELDEIKMTLSKHYAVKESVVVDCMDEAGEKFICAYFIAVSSVTLTELARFMLRTLPDYMIPAAFVAIDSIPTTLNGKLDRKKLPEPVSNIETGNAYQAAENRIEEAFVEVWKQVLKLDSIGVYDDFFLLGGNSLKAMNFIAKLEREHGIDLNVSEVYRNPTIRELAKHIRWAKRNQELEFCRAEEGRYYPLSSAQKRIYLSNMVKSTHSSDNNTASVFMVEGELDFERMEQALHTMISRHDTLRTSFTMLHNEPVQEVHEHVSFVLEKEQAPLAELDTVIDRFIRPFDLSRVPLIRAKIIELGNYSYAFCLDAHHIIFDGISKGIFMKELILLYQQEAVPLPEYQYKDYAVWQSKYLETEALQNQRKYWLNEYAAPLRTEELLTDYPRPEILDFQGEAVLFEISSDMTCRLNEIARKDNASLFMVMLAVYSILLRQYSGQEEVVVGVPAFGRPFTELDNVIGMFVNTLALRCYPEGRKTFREFLQEVKNKALNAFENQDYQFDSLVKDLGIKPSPGRNALFDTMLAFQNAERSSMAMEGIQINPYPMKEKVTTFDIVLHVYEGEALECKLTYSTQLFRRTTMEQFTQSFVRIAALVSEEPDICIEDIRFSGVTDEPHEESEELVVEFDF